MPTFGNLPFLEDQLLLVVVLGLLLILGLLVISLSLALILHHVITDRKQRLRETQIREAAESLAPAMISGENLVNTVQAAVRKWGARSVSSVLRRSRVQLSGQAESRAAEGLAIMGEVDRLLDEARAAASWKRIKALQRLGQCGGGRARQGLVRGLGDENFAVRRAARQGLLVHRAPESVDAAIDAYVEDSPLRLAWRRSFFARLAAVASDRLAELISGGRLRRDDLKLALDALAEERAPEALAVAVDRLDSPDPELRSASARLLGRLKFEESVDRLMELLDDPEWFVRATAARSLANLRAEDKACAALRRHLNDSVWWVRRNAADTLSSLGEQGTQTLMMAVRDEDRYARDSALAALAFVDLRPDQKAVLAELVQQLPQGEVDPEALDFLTYVEEG